MESTPKAENAAVVAAEAFAPLAYGEGPRIGVLGDTRCGKTEAMKRLIAEYMRRSPGPVIIADTKNPEPQFEGQYRRDKADLEKNPPDPNGPRVIVLRGERFSVGHQLDLEEVAEIQFDLVQKFRMPSLGVYDELDLACNVGQFRKRPSTIEWAFRRGGASGVASLWGTQETQEVPASVFNQSSVILAFRMQGAPLRLLKERGYLEPKGTVEKMIPGLPGDDLPPAQRGHHAALRRGRPWDGKTWRFQ